MNAKIIVLFNHKGGVSKTTTTYHLAWKLASEGKRVLLVDGDPQCNLTGLMLGDQFDAYYESEERRRENIKDAVAPAFNGSPQPLRGVECFHPQMCPNLYLIPGHMDLAAYETSLSFALNSNNALTTLQNLPGAFYEMIRLSCEEHEIDYVFIDMNPGLGALNQTFFMLCDGFIVPTNPDPFSLMAIKTLQSVLPRWKSQSGQLCQMFSNASYPMPSQRMKFVGEIIQRFNIRNGKPASQYVDRIDEIKSAFETQLVPMLDKHDMLFSLPRADGHCLATIQDYGALIQRAHQAGKPVFALERSDFTDTGIVLDGFISKVSEFKQVFETIASRIIEVFA